MNKTLVELTFTDIPEHYYQVTIHNHGEIGYTLSNLHNVVVEEYQLIPKHDTEMLHYYIDKGFEQEGGNLVTNELLYRKSEHYCFTQETKKILDELYKEEVREINESLRRSSEQYRKLAEAYAELADEIYDVDNASFFKRLKYLFTGRMV